MKAVISTHTSIIVELKDEMGLGRTFSFSPEEWEALTVLIREKDKES